MAKSRFKTKLSRAQKRKNILVFLTVIAFSYAFALFFGFSIGLFDNWTMFEILIIGLAMSFFTLSLLMFPVLLVSIVLGVQKGRARRVRDDSTFVPVQNLDYYRDNLSELNPSLVSLLIDLDIYGKKDMVATLLRMQNKKVISFQENGKIIVTGENQQLDNSERELLSIIKKGKLNSNKSFLVWKQNRFYDAERLGYIKKKPVKNLEVNSKYLILGFLSFIAAFFVWGALLASNLIGNMESVIDVLEIHAILLILDVFLFLPFYFLGKTVGYSKRGDVIWERTTLGNETAEKIAGLVQFIHEFSLLSEAKKEQVELWDDYLVYAIVLEENEKIVKDISKSISI